MRQLKRRSLTVWIAVQIAALLVIGYVLFQLGRDVAASEARDAAQAVAQAQAEVTVCRRGVANAPSTRRILLALEVGFENTIASAQDALASSPSAELDPIRLRSIARATKALDDLHAFMSRYERGVPTKAECDELARELDVPQGASR